MTGLVVRAIRGAARHRGMVRFALILLGVLAAFGVCRAKFTNDLRFMLPDTPETSGLFRTLRESRLADTLQVEFLADDDVAAHEAYLDAVVTRLARIPGVERVNFRYRSADPLADLAALSALTPRLNDPEVLRGFDPDAAAAKAVSVLAFPLPGAVGQVRRSPFPDTAPLLSQLRTLERAAGMRLAPELPYFATPDRRRAMIAVEAGALLGEAAAIRKLYDAVGAAVGEVPAGWRWRIVSGGNHTLGNEAVLKRDAAISGGVSLALLLLLFLVVCRRDFRALWIPAIPLYASLLALGLMTLFFREICWYVIGLGGCITGLAVDQGIHVYAACRGEQAEERTAALAVPMTLAAGTSITVFVLLGLTGVYAYIQLAVFAGTSLALSGIVALIVLPQFLRRDRKLAEVRFGVSPVRKRWLPPILAVIALCAAGWGAWQVWRNADLSLQSLDGTPGSTLAEERDFAAAWRRPDAASATLAVLGANGDAALGRLRAICARLRERGVEAAAFSLPPEEIQRTNRVRWRTPEARKLLDDLEARTRAACGKRKLPENFFAPFFAELRRNIDSEELTLPPLLRPIREKTVREDASRATALALLSDDPATVEIVREELAKENFSGCAMISKSNFRGLIRRELGGSFAWVLGAGAALSLLWAALVFRAVKPVLLSMVPLGVALAVLAILGGATGFRATPAAAFALALLTGLAADYGIYAVCQLREPERLSVATPVLLSAATTVAGAGALVFSRHPALFDTGVVLAVGIAVACFAGLVVVPWLAGGGKKNGSAALLLLALLLIGGCATPLPPAPPELAARSRIYPEMPFVVQASVTARFPGQAYTILLAAEIVPSDGSVRGAAVNPGSGTVLFRLGETAGLPPRMAAFAERMPEILRRIFLSSDGQMLAEAAGTEYIRLTSADGVETELHPWGAVRRSGGFWRSWRSEYRDAGRTVCYREDPGGCTLDLNITRIQRKEHVSR